MDEIRKMDKINMFWHKVPFGKENFGDVLGPYIVKHLTGKEPMYTPLMHKGFNKRSVITYLKAIYNRKLSLRDMYYNLDYLLHKKNNILISIGSVMDMYTNPDCDIWGSGIMFRDKYIANANFYAVRGKYSQLRLRELGYKVPQAIGDPALLTPLIYQPKSTKKYRLGIIPHFLHYDDTLQKLASEHIIVINLFDPIEKIIEEVYSCEKIISSSLHGIIIGHAYAVPSLWVGLAKGWIGGDDIKFADYFSSVGLDEYEYFSTDHKSYGQDYLESIEFLFKSHEQLTLVDMAIVKKIQIDLIGAAPFTVLPQYKEIKQVTRSFDRTARGMVTKKR